MCDYVYSNLHYDVGRPFTSDNNGLIWGAKKNNTLFLIQNQKSRNMYPCVCVREVSKYTQFTGIGGGCVIGGGKRIEKMQLSKNNPGVLLKIFEFQCRK